MNRIEFGDCREIMRSWAAEGVKVQTCITSPPYYGLRDYGHPSQLGLEQTPEDYIFAMVDVFRCVRDVLTDDGTLWLNIGDSYAGSGKGRNADGSHKVGSKQETNKGTVKGLLSKTNAPNCKSKDLIGIPWMLAFALRSDGWYLRQDIIWHKPNPMPESVQDRCTKAHEYIFLLSKSEQYFFDNKGIKEPSLHPTAKAPWSCNSRKERAKAFYRNPTGNEKNGSLYNGSEFRNKRSVWTVTTKPYKGAHFATFPTDLIEPCILAGSRLNDIVLDPFMGSGTTAQVALQHGRQYLGCELNPEYAQLQEERISQVTTEKNSKSLDLFEVVCPAEAM